MWQKPFDTTVGDITVAKVLEMLRNPFLAGWKRLPLAFIALVDGLLAFEAVPHLLARIPDAPSTATFLEYPSACATTVIILNTKDILAVEAEPDVTVHFSLIPEAERHMWLDEVEDLQVNRLVHRLRKQPENAPLPPEEKPEVVPIIQRNLRPRKPAVVVVEDVTSSEHNELEVPNQSGSSPDKYSKLWLSEQLQNVARGIYERLETMERNICSHLGVSPPNFHNTRKRKADDDSPKTDGIQAQRPPRKSMRTNSTVTKPTTKIHFYPQRSADRLEEPRAPYAVPDESNAENPVTTCYRRTPPCISDLSPTKRFGDEKSVTVTWEETNPHAYTSGKIALASETPPSADVETLSRDVSATKTQSAAVTEGATRDSVAVGNERSPVEEDENYESCQENISINTPMQEKHPLAVETLPGPDTDEDDNSVESGGKRLRKKSQKIRGVYTPDARLKGLFMSEEKTEYRPLPKTSRAIFKKFSDILTENLVQ
uniref:DUF1985 domain-containing protein n=1 Tax=Brassica oleracea TaxID=3712 RepID=A0A3P6BLC7_BRAOL|nr:unnamed protein product [Brassica oleracea]